MSKNIVVFSRLFVTVILASLLFGGCTGDNTMAPSNTDINLVANPTEIPSDGVSFSTIDAFLLTPDGPVNDGTIVYFLTNRGLITDEDGNPVHKAVTTDGLATVRLKSVTDEGTANITATSGSVSDSVSVSIGIQVNNISMSANPASFTVEDSNIHSYQVTVTAMLWNKSGNPIEGKYVLFSSDGGLMQSGGTATVTDSTGSVSDQWSHSVAVPIGSTESFMITATCGTVSNSVSISITNTSS